MPRKIGAAAFLLLPIAALHAQPTAGGTMDDLSDSLRQAHMVHVSPHLLVLDAHTPTTILTFSNQGDAPVEAAIVVQLGYTYWPNMDTVLLSPRWRQDLVHDTIIVHPGPQDHFVGAWLSGLPTHLVLQPRQTRRITVRVEPSTDLPTGEYYARIITLAGPKRTSDKGNSQDIRVKKYLPLAGHGPPLLRDSARIFYRQGPQTMGLQILQAEVKVDTTGQYAPERFGPHPLIALLRLHLSGTAHFEGYLSAYYLAANGDTLVRLTGERGSAFTLHRDGIMRIFSHTNGLEAGHYTYVLRLTAQQDEFPPAQRLPMVPVQVTIPFDVP